MKGVKKDSSRILRQKGKFLPRLIIVSAAVLIVGIITFVSYNIVNSHILNSDSVSAMYANWNKHSVEGYEKVYDISTAIIAKNPMHNTARTLKGYSCFMLAQSEVDSDKSHSYLDEGIFNLRVALQNAKKKLVPDIEYMLGRSYFYKDKYASYNYYADLAVKYLESALEHGYKSSDANLLLGLSFASLGQPEKSISAFSEALLVRETDTLLFDIGKQYFLISQYASAKQYLFRVLEMTETEALIDNTHLLLGQIYLEEKSYDRAEEEFNLILEKNENSADAHYGIGVIYESRGDTVKARAEWRKCLRIQNNHEGASKKMSEIK